MTAQLAVLKYEALKEFHFGFLMSLGTRYSFAEKRRIVAQIQQTRYSYDVTRVGLGLEFRSSSNRKPELGYIGLHLFHEDNQFRDNQLWLAAVTMSF